MGRWGAIAIILTSLLAGARALAQPRPAADFGAAHQVALSTERLFGYVHSSETQTMMGVEQTTTVNTIAIFSSPFGLATVYSSPRLAVDFFAADRISVGAAASYFRISEDLSNQIGAAPTFSGFLVAPRVGYAASLTPEVSLWPRLGLTITRLSLDSSVAEVSSDSTAYALTLEAPIVIAAAPHVFVAVAPTFDLGLGGSNSDTAGPTTTSTDTKVTSFGIQAALGGYF